MTLTSCLQFFYAQIFPLLCHTLLVQRDSGGLSELLTTLLMKIFLIAYYQNLSAASSPRLATACANMTTLKTQWLRENYRFGWELCFTQGCFTPQWSKKSWVLWLISALNFPTHFAAASLNNWGLQGRHREKEGTNPAALGKQRPNETERKGRQRKEARKEKSLRLTLAPIKEQL